MSQPAFVAVGSANLRTSSQAFAKQAELMTAQNLMWIQISKYASTLA